MAARRSGTPSGSAIRQPRSSFPEICVLLDRNGSWRLWSQVRWNLWRNRGLGFRCIHYWQSVDVYGSSDSIIGWNGGLIELGNAGELRLILRPRRREFHGRDGGNKANVGDDQKRERLEWQDCPEPLLNCISNAEFIDRGTCKASLKSKVISTRQI